MKAIAVVSATLALSLASALAQPGECEEVYTLRPGMQAAGTFSWVIHAMEYFGTAADYCLELEPTTYGSKQATELALRAGETDVVVDDIVGAVTLHDNGVPVKAVYPFSKATGGVVVPVDSDIAEIADLEGKTIAAASLDDKSLLILRALTMSEYGFDPQVDGETLQAAPWLMSGLLDQGEIDAGIPYWHFVARMTGTGEYRDLMMVTEMLERLGLRSDLPILVVVAREGVPDEAVRRFIEAMNATTARMRNDEGIWQSILDEQLYSLPDPSLFPEVRERWEAGLPEEWNQQMIDELVQLVDQLVAVAGPELVGVERIDPDAFTTRFVPQE